MEYIVCDRDGGCKKAFGIDSTDEVDALCVDLKEKGYEVERRAECSHFCATLPGLLDDVVIEGDIITSVSVSGVPPKGQELNGRLGVAYRKSEIEIKTKLFESNYKK